MCVLHCPYFWSHQVLCCIGGGALLLWGGHHFIIQLQLLSGSSGIKQRDLCSGDLTLLQSLRGQVESLIPLSLRSGDWFVTTCSLSACAQLHPVSTARHRCGAASAVVGARKCGLTLTPLSAALHLVSWYADMLCLCTALPAAF